MIKQIADMLYTPTHDGRSDSAHRPVFPKILLSAHVAILEEDTRLECQAPPSVAWESRSTIKAESRVLS